MAKWVFDQWDNVMEYPTLGIIAEPGDILDALMAPDARWSLNADQGAMETVYRYAVGGDPNYIEPTDGHVLTYSATENTYVPTAPESVGLPSVDAHVADKIDNPLSATSIALSATYEAGEGKRIYVSPDGDDANTGLTTTAAKQTLGAALTAMGTGVKGTIVLGHGDIDAGSGVNWTGYQCGLVGVSTLATRIVATAQTGPVLDLTGVGYDLNGTEFGGFSIIGDGTAGTAKKGLALDPDTSVILAWFHDITVRDTGGTPFDLGYAELCVFDRLLAYEPVNAAASDIPYFAGTGAFNGNTFHDCQINGVSAGVNVGASGAVVIKDNGSTAPHSNRLDTFKINYLHLPTDGTIFAIAGNQNAINDAQYFDTGKVIDATGTSHARFTVPSGGLNSGGNSYRGLVPGKSTGTNDIDCGVDIRQTGNQVYGVKGYRGTNVIIAADVNFTSVVLGGRNAAADDPAVVDNSGTLTNTIVDHYLAYSKLPIQTLAQGAASIKQDVPGGAWAGGPRFYDPTTPANGCVGLGTTGTRIQSVGASAFHTADVYTFRTIALANLFGISSTGVRGFQMYDSGGALPTATSAYRGRVAMVQGGAGVADRMVICRKDAADAYAWVDLF